MMMVMMMTMIPVRHKCTGAQVAWPVPLSLVPSFLVRLIGLIMYSLFAICYLLA